jgi:hypothetical protein
MLTGLEVVSKEVAVVVEVVAPIALVTGAECLNRDVDARREDVLSVRGHFVLSPYGLNPMTPHRMLRVTQFIAL